MRPNKCRVEWENHLPPPAGHSCFDAAVDAVGFLCYKSTLLAHVQVLIRWNVQVLLRSTALKKFSQSLLHLALLNFVRLTWAHFSSQSRSVWIESFSSVKSAAPLSLLSTHLLRVCLISSSMLLIKMLNSNSPKSDLWRTPFIVLLEETAQSSCCFDTSCKIVILLVVCAAEHSPLWALFCWLTYSVWQTKE